KPARGATADFDRRSRCAKVGAIRPRGHAMSAPRMLLISLLAAPLVACGLDRPIEPQPLVSVLDQWRAQVLAENASRIDGEPLDVVGGEFSGDFGRLGWDSPLMAET